MIKRRFKYLLAKIFAGGSFVNFMAVTPLPTTLIGPYFLKSQSDKIASNIFIIRRLPDRWRVDCVAIFNYYFGAVLVSESR